MVCDSVSVVSSSADSWDEMGMVCDLLSMGRALLLELTDSLSFWKCQ